MDRREAILSRLFTVLSSISGFSAVYRNRPLNPAASLRPALFLLDAHEAPDLEKGMEPAFRRLGITPMRMTPEIFISLGEAPENVGPSLNAIRVEVLKAVFNDVTSTDAAGLGSLVTPSGDVRYEGCATALTMASGVEGEMGVSLTFLYPLKPSEF
jgi:hypothetical protein